MKSLSFHNGSVMSREHNRRDERIVSSQDHIDPKLEGNNVYWHDESIGDAYRRIFGDALDEYNDKQTRADRKIDDYFKKIENDHQKHVGYEAIVQIGDRHDTGLDAPAEKEVLKEFVDQWSERNPNLELIGAYFHADEVTTGDDGVQIEGTVHVHIDYIPVARDCKRGLSVQNNLTKALNSMGFKTAKGKGTAQSQWQNRERESLKELCKERNIEIKPLSGERRQHEHQARYKAHKESKRLEAKAESLKTDLKGIESELEAYKGPITYMDRVDDIKRGVKTKDVFGPFKKPSVELNADDFDDLINIAKTNIVARSDHERRIKELKNFEHKAWGENQLFRENQGLKAQLEQMGRLLHKLNHKLNNEKGFFDFLRNRSGKNADTVDQLREEYEEAINPEPIVKVIDSPEL